MEIKGLILANMCGGHICGVIHILWQVQLFLGMPLGGADIIFEEDYISVSLRPLNLHPHGSYSAAL